MPIFPKAWNLIECKNLSKHTKNLFFERKEKEEGNKITTATPFFDLCAAISLTELERTSKSKSDLLNFIIMTEEHVDLIIKNEYFTEPEPEHLRPLLMEFIGLKVYW